MPPCFQSESTKIPLRVLGRWPADNHTCLEALTGKKIRCIFTWAGDNATTYNLPPPNSLTRRGGLSLRSTGGETCACATRTGTALVANLGSGQGI